MRRTGAWLFDKWGLVLAGVLLAGSLFFLVTAWLNIRGVERLGQDPGVRALAIVDVFFGLEAFHLSHLWLLAALYRSLRTPALLREGRVRTLLLIFVAVIAAGHFIAWQATQRGVDLGVVLW